MAGVPGDMSAANAFDVFTTNGDGASTGAGSAATFFAAGATGASSARFAGDAFGAAEGHTSRSAASSAAASTGAITPLNCENSSPKSFKPLPRYMV